MPHQINLQAIDTDGAVREAAEAVSGDTRLGFLRKGAVGGGALFGGGALMAAVPELAAAAGQGRPPAKFGKGDIGILNYALTLEYLERAFYDEATNNLGSRLAGTQLGAFLRVVTKDERAHVSFLKGALGSKGVKKPEFDFKGTTADKDMFAATAQVLENTGVGAYLGQAANLKSKKFLGAAGSILTIEARHSGAIGLINDPSGKAIATNGPFDKPKTAGQVLAAVKATGFIVG
ncbi:MAG TPA: ferritin-like domain-containing protein [Solirubrobacteraceae bacterium]|jgi:hypothetical protein|nr:ferritin-like domain-containing protein [Solirubrobacteraceae bacterium]